LKSVLHLFRIPPCLLSFGQPHAKQEIKTHGFYFWSQSLWLIYHRIAALEYLMGSFEELASLGFSKTSAHS
jgi:hypothetical protein